MARSFNGSSDIITLGALPVCRTTNFSFAFWFWLNAAPSAGSYFTFFNFNSSALAFYIKDTLKFAFYPGNTFASFNQSSDPWTASSAISAASWNHVAVVASGGTSATLYTNGAQNGSALSYGASGGSATVTSSLIGNDNSGLGRFWNGRVADLFFIDAVLTPLEIAALARGIRPASIRPKVSSLNWWPLDGLQSPEPDLSGNKNNGTLTGTSLAFGPPVTMITPRSRPARDPFVIIPPPLMGQICL